MTTAVLAISREQCAFPLRTRNTSGKGWETERKRKRERGGRKGREKKRAQRAVVAAPFGNY
jgi:hypothetical protein